MPMGRRRRTIGSPRWTANRSAGIFDISSPDFENVPESWMSYIAVDDVDARVKKAVKPPAPS